MEAAFDDAGYRRRKRQEEDEACRKSYALRIRFLEDAAVLIGAAAQTQEYAGNTGYASFVNAELGPLHALQGIIAIHEGKLRGGECGPDELESQWEDFHRRLGGIRKYFSDKSPVPVAQRAIILAAIGELQESIREDMGIEGGRSRA